MKLSSAAFQNNGKIPKKYTCEGADINPPLQIEDVPSSAKSLVLIMDDPDVPKSLRADGMWDHWVLYNLLPSTRLIEENTTPLCKVGMNTSQKAEYQGPCPPDREHRYFFKLYALDVMLELPSRPTKSQVEKAMKGHVVAHCELIGTYVKKGS